jgi:hypothetical protein
MDKSTDGFQPLEKVSDGAGDFRGGLNAQRMYIIRRKVQSSLHPEEWGWGSHSSLPASYTYFSA